MKEPPLPARSNAAATSSRASPKRFIGVCAITNFRIISLLVRAEANLVSVAPGRMAFTRTFIGAHSLAKTFVILTTAALVIE